MHLHITGTLKLNSKKFDEYGPGSPVFHPFVKSVSDYWYEIIALYSKQEHHLSVAPRPQWGLEEAIFKDFFRLYSILEL